MTDSTVTSRTNRRIVLARRPKGSVSAEDFRLEEVPLPPLAEGQFLVRNLYLSLDPYMRGRMDDAKSYAKPVQIGEVMGGGTVGEVIESRHPGFAVGDRVLTGLGWQQYAATDGTGLQKITSPEVPLSAWLGAVGMPGVTAWYGLNRILEPASGQTLCVSAAAGAVGSVVGQLAKAAGCRVVGIAGGERKCRLVVQDYGFDACVDYKAGRLEEDLKAAAPDGVDMLFENVGGEVMNAVFARMNPSGRVAVCGLIAGYNGNDIPLQRVRSILVNRLKVQGFIVSDHLDLWPQALAELGERVVNGSLKYRETIANGLESVPEAFMGLLSGANVGKQLVKLD
ncbi:MAG TPA: NADP-dependent oxidoreductase [Lautropia sp.]|nr:NADP-dependent oxidoreductase [Lautropia sp.]